jgi:hypothetical protein
MKKFNKDQNFSEDYTEKFNSLNKDERYGNSRKASEDEKRKEVRRERSRAKRENFDL